MTLNPECVTLNPASRKAELWHIAHIGKTYFTARRERKGTQLPSLTHDEIKVLPVDAFSSVDESRVWVCDGRKRPGSQTTHEIQ